MAQKVRYAIDGLLTSERWRMRHSLGHIVVTVSYGNIFSNITRVQYLQNKGGGGGGIGS